MSIEVKDDGDKLMVYVDNTRIGFIEKYKLQEAENLQKVLNKVVIAWYQSACKPKRSAGRTSIAGDLFHIFTLGIFEK